MSANDIPTIDPYLFEKQFEAFKSSQAEKKQKGSRR